MTYRSDVLDAVQRERIAGHLAAAEQKLLGASGALANRRREIERVVANKAEYGGPGYPSVARLTATLTEAQALVYEAHGELAAADAVMGRRPAELAAAPMLPDPPRLGRKPPADARSDRFWPSPYDPVGMLVWYLRYRPWWSTLDLAEGIVHGERAALREREREVEARSEPGARAKILPPLEPRR